jgi:hypothetical protein
MDERWYYGEYFNDKRHGLGVHVWKNGASYTGQFNQGAREGFGFYKESTGEQYWGRFKDNKREGFGMVLRPDGVTKEYCWREEGEQQGSQVVVHPDGNKSLEEYNKG